MELSQLSYEEALAQLRTIVDQLERGSLGLEQSLELYEKGVQLTRFCETRLEVVEERMQLLTRQGLAPGPVITQSEETQNEP